MTQGRSWEADRGLMEHLSERKVPLSHGKSRWPHILQRCTHHRPGLPLAVSQKKWLKRSLVLKLLSMIAEWEHWAPGQPTHDCCREPLILCHMTCSPIIPSGSHSTWSKWAKSQSVWMETLVAADCEPRLRPMTPLDVSARNNPVLRMVGSFSFFLFNFRNNSCVADFLFIDEWFYLVSVGNGNEEKCLLLVPGASAQNF